MLSIVILSSLARLATPAHAWRLARAAGWVLVACVVMAVRPAAAEDARAELDAALLDTVRHMAVEGAGTAATGKAGEAAAPRVEVVIGQLDSRLRLAPCQTIEPYLPAGMRLWGKSRIGLRCKSGPTPWNVYLPVTVKVFGKGLLVPAGATAGSVLTENELLVGEVDLAEEFTPAVVDPRNAVGRVLTTNLRAGQALRQAHLKSRQWFAAGETVRVVALGEGFALESEGQALGNGLEGQPVKVRTESGRVLTGVPAGERRVEVTL